MNFGEAIEKLKTGERIARSGWNGKGMFIYLNNGSLPYSELDYADKFEGISTELFQIGDVGTIPRLPNLNMKTVTGSTVTGWLASQTDILAEDWELYTK